MRSFSLFFILSILFFCSCKNESLTAALTEEYSKPVLTNKIVNLNNSIHKTAVLAELEGAKIFFKTYSLKSRNGKLVNYKNIYFDTSHVIMMENGRNYHNYTFNIIHEDNQNDEAVDNLVLSPLVDGTYETVLVRYYFSDEEKEKIRNGITVDSKGKVTTHNINWRNRPDYRTKRNVIINANQKEKNVVKY